MLVVFPQVHGGVREAETHQKRLIGWQLDIEPGILEDER